MNIILLEGEDQQLYPLVAHLVMKQEVLSYNLNYPYKTSPEYCWFVAVEDGRTLGFVPVKRKGGKAQINNYYVERDKSEVFAALLKEIIRALSPDFVVESVTQLRHVPEFERNGFSVVFSWKKYVKMKVFENEKKRV
jgi:hypothetical protein